MRPRRFTAALGAITLAGMLLAGCAAEPDAGSTGTPEPAPAVSVSGDPSPVAPQGTPAVLTTDLTTPWSIVFVGATALLSERDTGDILELTGDTTRVIGTIDDVVHQGESGLLG